MSPGLNHRRERKAEGELRSFPGMRLIQRASEAQIENEFK